MKSWLTLFFSTALLAFPSDFDIYQNRVSFDTIKSRLETYLQFDSELENYYTLTSDKFILFSSPDDKIKNNPEYIIHLGSDASLTVDKGIRGKKIAIDPGHFGGSFAYLEQRFVNMEPPYNVTFNEGTLTVCTALFLKELLEEKGAIVMLTKDKPSCGIYHESFFNWLQTQPQLWTASAQLSQIFRDYYNRLDLYSRAKKINDWNPDIVVIIHYNAHDDYLAQSTRTKATDKNFNLVFMPGAFGKKELRTKEDRYHFLRLLLSNNLEKSQALCDFVVHAMTEELNVSLLEDFQSIPYMPKISKQISPGVFARNLALTRLIHAPLVYGESLIQNNYEECLKLADTSLRIHGIATNIRVKQVALSYFKGIMKYFEEDSL